MADSQRLLQEVVSKPEAYGDTVHITMLQGRGLSIVPMNEKGEPIEERRLILDPTQTLALSQRISMDPRKASELVAESIMEEYKQTTAPLSLITLVFSVFALALGILIGAFIF